MKIRKANSEEVKEYSSDKKLHPLYGFIKIDGMDCPIEYLGEGKENPNYEIMAPDGFHFSAEGILHTLLCFTLSEVKLRAGYETLEPCRGDC